MADITQVAGLIIKVKDEASSVVAATTKVVKDFDKALRDSEKITAATGKAAEEAAYGFEKLGEKAKETGDEIGKSFKALGIRSTKEIKDEVLKLEKAYSTLKNSGKASAGELARAEAALLGKTKELNAELSVQKVGMADLGSAVSSLIGHFATLAATAAIVVTPVIETAKFERSMAEVRSILGGVSDNEFQKLTDLAREMGAATEFSAQQAAEGLKYLAMAGLSAVEAMDALPGVLDLAQAGNVSLGQSADIATNVLAGMGLEISQLGRVNDVLVETFTSTNSSLEELGAAMSYVGPVAAQLGISIEDTSTALGLLHSVGIKGSAAGTSLKGALTQLIKPSGQAAKAMAEVAARIGQTSLEITDSSGKLVGLKKVIGQFERAGITAAEAMAILGQEAGPGMMALVSQGSGAFEELSAKLLTSEGRAKEVSKVMHDNLVGDFRSATSAISELALSVGEKMIPAARVLVQIFGGMVTTISSLIKDYPTLSSAVMVLVGAFLALAAAASTISISKAILPLIAIPWTTMAVSVTSFTTSIVAGFGKASASILAFSANNPALVAIISVIGIATAAYAIFGQSAEDSAKKHQANAEAIGESRKKLGDEVKELEAIKKILSEEMPGSEKFVAAQERIVELIPGTNNYLDEQGRLLAVVGEDGKAAAAGLDEYIGSLKTDEQQAFVDQLEQQQKSFQSATKGTAEFSKKMKDLYGRGGEGEASFFQKINKSVSSLLGGYQRYIKMGSGLRESSKQSEQGLNSLLKQALASGMGIDQLSEALGRGKVSSEDAAKILERYTKLVAATGAAQKKAAEEASKSGKSTVQGYADQEKSVEQLKEELNNYKDVQKTVGEELKAETSTMGGALKGIESGYNSLAAAAKQRAASEIAAIDEITAARLAGVKQLPEGQRIAEEIRIIREGNNEKLRAISEYAGESERLLTEESEKRRSLAQSGSGDTSKIDQEVLASRRALYAESVQSYRAMVDSMIAEENRHLDRVKVIEEEKRNLKLSTEDKIRQLERQGQSESEQYADKSKQVDEKQSAAKRALAEGDFEQAKRLNEQAMALAESSIRQEAAPAEGGTGGVSAADAKQSTSAAIEELKQSEQIGQAILSKMMEGHAAAAAAMATDRSRIESSLVQAERKLTDLDGQLQALTVADIEMNSEQVDVALSKVSELSAALEELNGKVINTEVVITERTVEARAAGGVVGKALGKFKRMVGSVVTGGSGGIDDVPTMLTRDEGVITVGGMRKIGSDVLRNLKDGRLDLPDIKKLVSRGVIDPQILKQGSPVAGNVSTSTFNLQIDGVKIRPTSGVQSATQHLLEAVSTGYGHKHSTGR